MGLRPLSDDSEIKRADCRPPLFKSDLLVLTLQDLDCEPSVLAVESLDREPPGSAAERTYWEPPGLAMEMLD